MISILIKIIFKSELIFLLDYLNLQDYDEGSINCVLNDNKRIKKKKKKEREAVSVPQFTQEMESLINTKITEVITNNPELNRTLLGYLRK